MKNKKALFIQYFIICAAVNIVYGLNSGVTDTGMSGIAVIIVNLFCAGILIICGIGLMGALLVFVEDNQRSIGVQAAIGASSTDIVRWLFADCTFKPSIIPFLLGCAFGQAFLQANLLPQPFETSASAVSALLCALLCLIFLILCTIYPAYIVLRLNPSEILRGD